MFTQMLRGDQFTFPSGYVVSQQPIENDFITVNLKNGWLGRNKVFGDIMSGKRPRIYQQKVKWREEGIEYTVSTNREEKYKLKLPVHNMNDVLFANFFQESNFGNWKIWPNSNWGTIVLYAGPHARRKKAFKMGLNILELLIELLNLYLHPLHLHLRPLDLYLLGLLTPLGLLTIKEEGSNFQSGMAELKRHAAKQQALGNSHMCVGTTALEKDRTGKYHMVDHVENIDIDALLALDLDNMEIGKAYPIGDRNWGGDSMSWGGDSMSYDIPRLAVRKVNNSPVYEFGTLRGISFETADFETTGIFDVSVFVD
jgi:hypothetical protein